MAQFVLLLTKGNFEGYSPEEMQGIVERYFAWINHLRKEGRYRAGEELKPIGRVLRSERKQVIDGPFTETKESVGGFFMIEAENLDEAVKISKECPHLDYQGEIEVREVNPH